MTHKIKALGIATFAVLAMSAMATSAAQANENAKFTATAYPTTAFATDGAKGNELLTVFGLVMECNHVEFHGTLAAASPTLTINPTFNECVSGGILPATFNMTSCDFLFHVGTTKAADEYNGSMSIACTKAGDTIDTLIYASKPAHTENKPICHITIGAQGPLPGLTFKVDTGAVNDVTVSGTATGFAAKQTRTSATCPPGTEEKAGKYAIKTPLTFKGSNPVSGEPRSFDIG
jgi:hypothetical protein